MNTASASLTNSPSRRRERGESMSHRREGEENDETRESRAKSLETVRNVDFVIVTPSGEEEDPIEEAGHTTPTQHRVSPSLLMVMVQSY